jgi:hypothetical protein
MPTHALAFPGMLHARAALESAGGTGEGALRGLLS